MEKMPSPEQRSQLARSIMLLFDQWGIEPQDRVRLLGLAADTRTRVMQRFRSGEPLPEDEDVLERAHLLACIDSALHTTFPHNPTMASYWVTTENRYFNNATPLSLMLHRGIEGLRRIRDHLDSTSSWF